ncbi:MAG TPA: hypothetical protein VES67_19060 [Vicinamibacterales bacterium]|nr:hypothetical protein [Vicinamibacterales bacterium]
MTISALLMLLMGSAPAWAQLSRVGSVTALVGRDQIGAGAIKGTDTNYDPVNDVFLIVGAYGPHFGMFVNRYGVPVTGFFFIKTGGLGSHFPRARYSPHVNGGQGGFLVTWSEEGSQGQHRLHTRVVAFPGTLVGGENIISDSTSHPWIESGAAIGYSPISQRFYVAWRTYPGPTTAPAHHLSGRLVGLDGAGIGAVQTLSSGLGRDPGVVWNSVTNEFGVSFNGENAGGTAGFSAFARVSPIDGGFSRQTFNFISGFTYISDIDFNPYNNRYVMTWWQNLTGGPDETHVAEIDSAGNLITTGLVTTLFAGYDSLSIAFNALTGTFVLVSLPSTDQVYAAELNWRGFRTSALTEVGPGVITRYARVSVNTESNEWNTSFSHNYLTAVNLIIATSSTGGGPPGAYGPPGGTGGGTPPPPPPPPPPGGCTTPQPASDWVCVNGNWLPPSSGGGSGNPSCPTVQPAPDWVCVNGNWLPPSSGGGSGNPNCPTVQPGPTWVCVNGNWLPGSGGGGTGNPSCPTVQPAPDWVCVNGNWLPPTSGGGGSSCTTPQPGPTWVCVNGNWLPPGSGGGSSCTTPQPGPTWVCVNGNWLPPTSGGGSGCPTVQPGPTWVCVNGNWLPPTTGGTSSCPTVQPAPDWVCVNGNWLPPSSGGGGSSCTTPQPGPTWICVNGNWLPPSSGGSCTTPQPGPTWICVNGNWLPGPPLVELALSETPPGSATASPPAAAEATIEMLAVTADRGFVVGRRPALSI